VGRRIEEIRIVTSAGQPAWSVLFPLKTQNDLEPAATEAFRNNVLNAKYHEREAEIIAQRVAKAQSRSPPTWRARHRYSVGRQSGFHGREFSQEAGGRS